MLLIGGLILVAGLSAVLWHYIIRTPDAPGDPLTEEQKTSDLRAAFGGGEAGSAQEADADTRREIETVLTDLHSGRRSSRKLVDADATAGELIRIMDTPAHERREITMGIRRVLGRSMRDAMKDLGKPEIRHVRVQDGRQAAIAYCRHVDSDGVTVKIRWWLSHSDDNGWRVWDFEELSMGIRATTSMAAMISEGTDHGDRWLKRYEKDYDALTSAIQQGDFEKARKAGLRLDKESLPDVLQGVVQLLIATAETGLEHPDKALAHVERAQKLGVSAPALDLIRSSAYCFKEQWQEALEAAERYEAILGPDDVVSSNAAVALENLGRIDEAIAAYGRSLGEEYDVDCLFGMASIMPPERMPELATFVQQMPRDRESLETLCKALLNTECYLALREVARGYAAKHGPNKATVYYEPEAEFCLGNLEAAAAGFAKAIPLLKDPDYRKVNFEEYLACMGRLDRATKAYATVPDDWKEKAFDMLAPKVVGHDSDQLAKLIQAHSTVMPHDPLLAIYKARLLMREDDLRGAETIFAEWRGKPLIESHRRAFDYWHADALYYLDRWRDAYELGPSRERFGQLASYMDDNGEADDLAALVKLHEAKDPKDPAIPWYGALADFRAERFAEAADGLQANRDRILAEDGPAGIVEFEQLLIDAQLSAGRPEDALTVAKRSTARDGDPWFEVVVYAHRRQSFAFAAAVEKLLKLECYNVASLYSDTRIVEAMDDPAFADLRTKYPRPVPTTAPASQPAAGT